MYVLWLHPFDIAIKIFEVSFGVGAFLHADKLRNFVDVAERERNLLTFSCHFDKFEDKDVSRHIEKRGHDPNLDRPVRVLDPELFEIYQLYGS